MFAEQLPKERSFPVAFEKAAALARTWDAEHKRQASHPRVFEGSAIRAKLQSVE